jgi:hypothetical protein
MHHNKIYALTNVYIVCSDIQYATYMLGHGLLVCLRIILIGGMLYVRSFCCHLLYIIACFFFLERVYLLKYTLRITATS